MTASWWQSYFDQHFYELYAPLLPEEEAAEEAAAVAELLGLEPGDRVLDLACGWGRHSVELAAMGLRVTGLDRSEALLQRGRALAARRGAAVEWICADAREIPSGGGYGAVISMFSSLGYFLDDREDLRVLRGVRDALAPAGLFLLETMHRDLVARAYAERDWWEGSDGRVVWVEREFDAVAGVSHEVLRWRGPEGEGEREHSIRVRSATEWARLLEAAGLEAVGWYGGWDGEPFETGAERLVVVARAGDASD